MFSTGEKDRGDLKVLHRNGSAILKVIADYFNIDSTDLQILV